MPKEKIIAVDVYLERRKTREYVGRLEKKKSFFVFNYDNKYLYSSQAMPIGPDLPVTKKTHKSKNLFLSFKDRIPSRKNPAYEEYCDFVGISMKERDPIVLLATLGQKGPSSFILAPVTDSAFTKDELIKFRKSLKLSVREFANLFGFGSNTIHKIEIGKSSGKDVLKRVEIYKKFPNVALYELNRSGFKVSDKTKEHVKEILNREALANLQDKTKEYFKEVLKGRAK